MQRVYAYERFTSIVCAFSLFIKMGNIATAGHYINFRGEEPEPDRTEGTVTVTWSDEAKEDVTTVQGCIVKNDPAFRELTGTQETEKTKYFAYSPDFKPNNNHNYRAIIKVYRFTKPSKKKKCDAVNKKLHVKDHHYIFLPCNKRSFNKSSFLSDYSKSVISSNLSPCTVCEQREVVGLSKENEDRLFKLFSFDIKRDESNVDSFYIEDDVFDKLEDTGPLLIESGETLVGCYRKSVDNIAISTFNHTGNSLFCYTHYVNRLLIV
jgi:hypothetical protein